MSEAQACIDGSFSASIDRARDLPAVYKRTEVGVIPKDWCVCQLDSLGTGRKPPVKAGPFGSSLTKAMYVSSGYKVYGQEQVIRGDPQYGDYYIARKTYLDLEACAVNPGDILMSLVGTVGKLLVVPKNAEPGIINPRLLRFSLDRNRILPLFFRFLFETEHLQTLLSRSMQGGTMGILNAGILRSVKIPVPPEHEQRAIAEAFSDVDGLLESLDALIAKKRAIKQAAMQQLLTGKTRLPEFGGEWETKRVGDLLHYERPDRYIVQCTDYSEYGDVPVLTANKSFVLGYTDESFGICTEIPVIVFDDFTTDCKYAASPFKVKSSAIKLLRARQNQAHLKYMFERMRLIQFPLGDHRRYYIADYQNIELLVPDFFEQQALATVLSDMDAEVATLESRRDKTHAIKQGMMQQLFTGRVRLI